MAEINLTQSEADALIAMPKCKVDEQSWNYPALGGLVSIPLVSQNRRERFVLDVWRSGNIALKGAYQNRARQVVTLVRLDFGGAPHRNPDDVEVSSPHLHVYREGFADKWAVPVPRDVFGNTGDLWQTLMDFMRYCNIVDPPSIARGLFS